MALKENMSLGARAAHTVSFVLGGNLINLLLTGILLIALTRILGPSEYGVYTFAIAIAAIFGAVDSTGIATTMNKFVSEYGHRGDIQALRRAISNGVMMVIILGGALTVIALLLSGPIATYWLRNGSLTLVLQLVSLTIFLALIASALNGVLVGIGRRGIVASLMVQSAFQVIVSILLAIMGFGALAPVIGLIAAYAAGTFASIYIITRFYGIRFGISADIGEIKKLFLFSIPVSLSNMSVSILPNIAVILLGIYETAATVGNFGIGLRVYTLLGTIITAISFSLLPTYTITLTDKKMLKKLDSAYNYSVYFAFVFLIPAILFIVVMSKQVSYTLFGGSYVLAPYYMSMIALGFAVWIVGAYASSVLVGANRVWEVLKYNLVVDVIVLAIMPLVSGFQYGFGIVADIFILAPLLYDIVFFTRVHGLFGIGLPVGKLVRVSAANLIAILFVIAVYYITGTNFVIGLVFSVIVLLVSYPPFLGLLGGVTMADLKLLEKVTLEIPLVGPVMRFFAAYTALTIR